MSLCISTAYITVLTVQDSNVLQQHPSHLHKGVKHHLIEFLKYLQFPLQAFIQEQCSSIEQAELTSFSVVQNGIQMLSCSFHSHPYSAGLGRLISFLKHLSQMNAETRIVLLTCWTSAAWVGGIRSRDTSLWVNILRLASLTELWEHVLLYKRTVNCSIRCIWADLLCTTGDFFLVRPLFLLLQSHLPSMHSMLVKWWQKISVTKKSKNAGPK